MKYLTTLRCTFNADDELEARLVANEVSENAGRDLEEDDTVDVTQVIPLDLADSVEPTEMVNHLRLCRDMLIKTRIVQCYDLARELDKVAWILEHRAESTFDISGYDWGAMVEITERLLGRKSADDNKG